MADCIAAFDRLKASSEGSEETIKDNRSAGETVEVERQQASIEIAALKVLVCDANNWSGIRLNDHLTYFEIILDLRAKIWPANAEKKKAKITPNWPL